MQGIKKEQVNSYIWKGSKSINNDGNYIQVEEKMVNLSEAELKAAYNHCITMLYNRDGRNPGRYLVLEIIDDQINKCGAELFLRYAEKKGNSRLELVRSINAVLKDPRNAEVFKTQLKPNEVTVDLVFSEVPTAFKTVPLEDIIDGGLDQLGELNKKHLTRTLILRQGIWLTPEESSELMDNADKSINRMDIIRERLNIKDVERLSYNPKGFSFTEMRALLTIRPNKKYRDLATIQLETLRNKLLPLHEQSVRIHIDGWEERMRQIEEVAAYNSFIL